MLDSEIKLGDEYQCIVSGFKGIAEEKSEFLNGCVQLLIRPKQSPAQKKINEYPKGTYVDIQQLKRVGNGINKKTPVQRRSNGGATRDENRNRI